MVAYILSIIGIVFLGVLVDVIMPEGTMNKYIKGMFGLIALFVIVYPISQILNSNIKLDDVFYNSSATAIDKDFLQATNKQIKSQIEKSLQAKLVNAGFENVDVEIECDLSQEQFTIKKVRVDISKMVINQNMVHINKYTEIKKVVTEFVNVEEDDVVIDEWRKKGWQTIFFGQS